MKQRGGGKSVSECVHVRVCALQEATANPDSVLKSRDITLLTKVHVVKAMFFFSSHYRYESWTIKKGERQRTDAFKLVLEKTLESPLNCKEIKPVNSKGNQPWIFVGRTEAELQYFGHLRQRADSLEKTLMLGKIEGRRRRGRQRMRWLEGIINSMDESEQTLGDSEGQGSPWNHKQLDTIE